MNIGKIIEIKANFYFVNYNNKILKCVARDILKKKEQELKVGDNVVLEKIEDDKGVIIDIKERINELSKPSIANIDQAVIVMSCNEPTFSSLLLDKILCVLSFYKIEPLIVLNKIDIDTDNIIDFFKKTYLPLEYKAVFTSVNKNIGLKDLYNAMKNKTSIFMGPSGVGKSSILNSLSPELNLKVKSISSKLKRGTHTTRHVTLFTLNIDDSIAYVADSPGFLFFNLPYNLPSNELMWCFKEFIPFINNCKYHSCLHYQEPDCAIKNNIDITSSRYINYTILLQEIIDREKNTILPLRMENKVKLKTKKQGKILNILKVDKVPKIGSRKTINQNILKDEIL